MKYKTAELEGDALDYMVQCAQRGEQPLCSVAEWKAGSDDGWDSWGNECRQDVALMTANEQGEARRK